MVDLLDTIQFTDPRRNGAVPAESTDFMEQPELHIINNMSSALAPMAKMLESKYVLKFAGSDNSEEFWKAIVSNEIFWKVRRAVKGKNRDNILRQLANYESQSIKTDVLKQFDVDLVFFARMFKIAQKYEMGQNGRSLFRNNQVDVEGFTKFMTGLDYNLFLLTEVVRSLICCNRATKKLKYPSFDKAERNWKWMKEEVDRRNDISSEQLEADEAWDNFLQEAAGQTLSQFAASLNDVIPNEFETFKAAGDKKKHKFKVEEVFDKLKNSKDTVQVVEKLKLVLLGKSSDDTRWGNGKGLKNGMIAKQILDFLKPQLKTRADSNLDIGRYAKMIEKTNQYTKHWYRKEGSRKKYTNERPSFWAITKFTTPWSFLKNDKEGYHLFLESLRDIADDNDEAKNKFHQDWEHLLRLYPTKNDTRAHRPVTSADARPVMKDRPASEESPIQKASQESASV